ncbi:MAG TPA: PAS domain-containing protein, partial [Pseudomonadales bacterium]
MPLRNHLLLVVLASLLPVVLFAAITGYRLVDDQRETFLRAAEERTQTMLAAVDTQLNGALDAIRVLSQSESLTRGDLVLFRATARRVLATQTGWNTINVALPTGERLMDLLVPAGEPLPPITVAEDSFARVVQTRAATIGQLALGPTSGSWDYVVRAPVMEQGSMRYVLSAVIDTNAIASLVLEQNLPRDWIGVVLDANDRIVARTREPIAGTGELAPSGLRDALTRAPEGWFTATTSDASTDIYVRYRKSQATGWTFALAMPSGAVEGAAARAYALFAFGLALALVLAFVFAKVVGRRIAAPIAVLSTITDDVGRGAPVSIPASLGVKEVDKFARTLAGTLDALRAREERLQLALSAGRMGHWDWDVQTNAVTWSAEMHAIHGLPPDSYSGRESGSYAQYVHPDDREAVRLATMSGLEHGEHHIEYRIIRPDGTLRWLEGRGRIFRDAAGVPIRMLGLCTDITERKNAEHALQESETRFREIADTAPAILWITDADARISFLSQGWFDYTGQSEAQAFGKHGFGWLDAVHPDDRERSAHTFQQANARREAFAFDYRLRCASGEYRWAIDSGKPRVNAEGGFIGFVGAVVDIDARKRAEQALREADRHKDDFLATLSHELRNPLAALTTAAHVLRSSPNVDARSAAVHGVIDRQTQHMVRLIEDLLDMTRIRLGKISLRKAPLDLAALVTEVTRTKRIAGDFDGHAPVTVDAAPVWVEGDAARLEQVYANLLDNALKFTPESGAIHVTLRADAAYAVLSVRDNGRGIAREMLPKIFDMFV